MEIDNVEYLIRLFSLRKLSPQHLSITAQDNTGISVYIIFQYLFHCACPRCILCLLLN